MHGHNQAQSWRSNFSEGLLQWLNGLGIVGNVV